MSVPLRRTSVDRGDVTLSCLTGGAGEPVVLVPGLAGSATELTATAEALLSAYQVIVCDPRGHGLSSRRPADLDQPAAWLAVLRDFLPPAV